MPEVKLVDDQPRFCPFCGIRASELTNPDEFINYGPLGDSAWDCKCPVCEWEGAISTSIVSEVITRG